MKLLDFGKQGRGKCFSVWHKNSSTILREGFLCLIVVQISLLPLNYCVYSLETEYRDSMLMMKDSQVSQSLICTIPAHVICSSLKYFFLNLFAQLNVPLPWSEGKNHDKWALHKHFQCKTFYLSLKLFCFLFSFVLKRIDTALIQGSIVSEL